MAAVEHLVGGADSFFLVAAVERITRRLVVDHVEPEEVTHLPPRKKP